MWMSHDHRRQRLIIIIRHNFPPQRAEKTSRKIQRRSQPYRKGEESCEWRLMRWWKIEKLSEHCQVSPKTCFSYRANGFGDKILMKKVEEQAASPEKTPRSALCVLIFYETLIFYLSLVITRKINIWWIQELESMNGRTPFVFFVFVFGVSENPLIHPQPQEARLTTTDMNKRIREKNLLACLFVEMIPEVKSWSFRNSFLRDKKGWLTELHTYFKNVS